MHVGKCGSTSLRYVKGRIFMNKDIFTWCTAKSSYFLAMGDLKNKTHYYVFL